MDALSTLQILKPQLKFVTLYVTNLKRIVSIHAQVSFPLFRIFSMVNAILILIILLTVCGCSLNANITNLNPPLQTPPSGLPVEMEKFISFQFVSGSSSNTRTTISGYTVRQSLGVVVSRTKLTTPNGFAVYLNAGGRINSAEIQK